MAPINDRGLLFWDSGTHASNSNLVYTAGGSLGIGTASPQASLHVASSGAAYKAQLVIQDTSNTAASTAGNGAGMSFYGSDLGSNSTGRIAFIGKGGGGSNDFNFFNQINSHMIFSTNATEVMRITSSGSVGIGLINPSEALEVSGNVKATAFISTSDERLKENVVPAEGLKKVLKLKGVQYDWIKNGSHDYGLIAQAVEFIFPSAVVTDAQTGFKAIKYQNLISPIIESVKELYRMITGTNEEVKILKRDIASVKAQNDKLAKENLELKEKFLSLEERLNKMEKSKK